MAKKVASPVKSKDADLLEFVKKNPTLRPKEIQELYNKKHKGTVTTQKVQAVKKQLALPAPTPPAEKENLPVKVQPLKGKALPSATVEEIPPALASSRTEFKNSRTNRIEVQEPGQPLIYFQLPGLEGDFSLKDLHEMILKNCGRLTPSVPDPIKEIPIESVIATEVQC